jgi:hypothetical protein
MVFGCSSPTTVPHSRLKRATTCGSCDSSCSNVLSATLRMAVPICCSAVYTRPMPPSPSRLMTRNLPPTTWPMSGSAPSTRGGGSKAPHFAQNRAPSAFGWSQAGQFIPQFLGRDGRRWGAASSAARGECTAEDRKTCRFPQAPCHRGPLALGRPGRAVPRRCLRHPGLVRARLLGLAEWDLTGTLRADKSRSPSQIRHVLCIEG